MLQTKTALRAVAAALTLGLVSSASAAPEFSRIVSFGDSLTDRGNTVTTLGPLADAILDYDQFYKEAAYNRFGIEADGRFSSGPTWVEYLNDRLIHGNTGTPVDLGANNGKSTTSTTTNFSWGGALSGSGHFLGVVDNLLTQIDSYKANTALTPHAGSTLFTVWAGGNDIISWVDGSDPESTMGAATDVITANIVTAITELYNANARHFLLPNLPALGFKPNYVNTSKEERANNFVIMLNDKLADAFDNLGLVDANIYELDVFSIFNELRDNPGDYGFTNTEDNTFVYGPDDTSYVVGNPEEYIFWDTTHPTAQVHEILGNFAFQAIPEPTSFVLLAVGAAVALRGRRKIAA